ncbi:hypothetical protein MESS2_60005 [Mesorhizobium metallidurans STM 2683]|uniref:Uncharacterized protein n=1 Tax=Mesorhizobium metallidurans STM 2683 TaxID=1297569 RepID=M5ETE5_9HYPH|nr:hypothetical protein MESS2_60005 [Mesorhizobium metallidurans STM 2683]
MWRTELRSTDLAAIFCNRLTSAGIAVHKNAMDFMSGTLRRDRAGRRLKSQNDKFCGLIRGLELQTVMWRRGGRLRLIKAPGNKSARPRFSGSDR